MLDGSGSIDAQDWDLQLRGYAAALQDPVNFPLDGTFSVSIVQWAYRSAATSTRVEIPLTNLDSRAALDSVVAAVNDIDQIGSSTNPGDGIRTGTNELIQNGRDDARWTLVWQLGEGESVAQHWSADLINDAQGTSATHLSWNRTIAPGGSVTFGFIGATTRPDGDVTAPTSFTLNGGTCT